MPNIFSAKPLNFMEHSPLKMDISYQCRTNKTHRDKKMNLEASIEKITQCVLPFIPPPT